MFFGKYPPRGFHDRPGARYLLPSDSHTGTPATPPPGAPAAPPPGKTPAPAEAAAPPTDPKADPYREPEPQPGLFDQAAPPHSAPAPPTTPAEADEPVSWTSGPDESTPPAPPRPDDSTPRVPNWGTDVTPEPRPGVPPPPLADAPAVEFHPSREVPQDRRSFPRVELFVNFTIQQVDEWGAVLQEELTVADNVGKGGARVMTTLGFSEGSVILLQEAGGGFATRAEVRGITRVQPGTDRLHLRFVDREAPERLLRQ